MTPSVLAPRPGAAVSRAAAVVVLGFLAAYLAWQACGWGGPAHRELIGDLAIIPINLGAAIAAAHASVRGTGDPRLRRGWRFVAVGLLAFALGDVLQALYEVVLHRPASPSPADIGYLAFYPLVLCGIISFPTAKLIDARERVAIVIDLAMVALAGAVTVWYVVLGPAALHQRSALQNALSIAYPVGDLLLFCALGHVVARRSVPGARRSLRLLGVAALAFVVGDLAWGWMQTHSTYTGGDWVDIPYTVAMALFTFAALAQPRVREPDPVATSDGRAVGWLAHLAPLLLLGMIAVAERHRPFVPDQILIFAAMVVLVLSVVRQFTAQHQVLEANRALAAAHAEIEALAATDSLTGLPNHRAMVAALDLELERAGRYERECAVLFIDVDRFKALNDSRGHAAGDAVLVEVGWALRSSLRAIDTIGRWGGEEFVAVIPEAGADAALATAERMRAAISRHAFSDPNLRITCSIGVAAYPMHGMLREALVDAADRAMYTAKREGRDRARGAALAAR